MLRLITDATTEPITLAEAKLHLRVESAVTADDTMIETIIAAARQQCEQKLKRALLPQTWERVIDAFPSAEIKLGRPPVTAITYVRYLDTAGDEQTMDSADYVLDSVRNPGWLLPAADTTWPTTIDSANAVRVRFVSGYASASAVPAAIKTWLLLRIGTLYKFREEIVGGQPVPLPEGFADSLLERYVIYGA